MVWTALRGIKEVLRGVPGHHSGIAFVVALEKVCLSQVSPTGSLPPLVGVGWAVFVQQVGGCTLGKSFGDGALGRHSPYWGRHCGAVLPVAYEVFG